MSMFELSGRKAILTGGTRGLGLSMAQGLLEAGVETVIMGSNEKVHEVAKTLSVYGNCHGLAVDLSDADARGKGFDEALNLLGGELDLLVNAAGVQSRHKSEEFPAEDWNWVMEVNLNAVFDYCQRAAQVMLPKGQGKIVNIASLLSFFGGFTVPAYAASKGGVMQMTKALSNEWASQGINVNAIAPGYMATDMNTALLADEGRNAEITARIPAKRWGQGPDMIGPLLFLASDASNYVHGTVLPVDGGYLGR